jgi:hypothetical protein
VAPGVILTKLSKMMNVMIWYVNLWIRKTFTVPLYPVHLVLSLEFSSVQSLLARLNLIKFTLPGNFRSPEYPPKRCDSLNSWLPLAPINWNLDPPTPPPANSHFTSQILHTTVHQGPTQALLLGTTPWTLLYHYSLHPRKTSNLRKQNWEVPI